MIDRILSAFALVALFVVCLLAFFVRDRPEDMPTHPGAPIKPFLVECGRCLARAITTSPSGMEAVRTCMACGGIAAAVRRDGSRFGLGDEF